MSSENDAVSDFVHAFFQIGWNIKNTVHNFKKCPIFQEYSAIHIFKKCS